MALNDNLNKLGILMQAMEQDHLSRGDFDKAFKRLIDAVRAVRTEMVETGEKNNAAAVKEMEKKVAEAFVTIRSAESIFKEINNKAVAEMKSDARTTMRMVEQGMKDIEAKIPDEFDASELMDEIQSVREAIPKIPEIPKEFDATEIMGELEEHEREIEELKKRPAGTGGGVTNARIIQAMKYILKTEAPVGDIDGANTTYTVSQPIFAVFAFSLNGEVITQLPNYTIAGNTVEFSSALPAAYSGKDFEIKYV